MYVEKAAEMTFVQKKFVRKMLMKLTFGEMSFCDFRLSSLFAGVLFLESPKNAKTEDDKEALFSPKRILFEINCKKKPAKIEGNLRLVNFGYKNETSNNQNQEKQGPPL